MFSVNDCTKKTLDIIKMVDLAVFWRFGDFLYTMIFIITVLLFFFFPLPCWRWRDFLSFFGPVFPSSINKQLIADPFFSPQYSPLSSSSKIRMGHIRYEFLLLLFFFFFEKF